MAGTELHARACEKPREQSPRRRVDGGCGVLHAADTNTRFPSCASTYSGAVSTASPRTAVWPSLLYRDANAAIAFLVAAFGFEEVVVYRNPDTSIVEHAELRWPEGGGVMLGNVRPDSGIGDLPPGVGAVYVVVSDPDALYARAQANGATITRAMRDEEYGSRGFAARDPEGVIWSFGTYAGAGTAES